MAREYSVKKESLKQSSNILQHLVVRGGGLTKRLNKSREVEGKHEEWRRGGGHFGMEGRIRGWRSKLMLLSIE